MTDFEVTEKIEGLDFGDTCKVRVYDIDWDTSDPEHEIDASELPGEVELEVNVDDLEDGDPDAYLRDVLSDEYGFCINSFSWDYVVDDDEPVTESIGRHTCYYTFGVDHRFHNKIQKITAEDPREVMNSIYGTNWSWEYWPEHDDIKENGDGTVTITSKRGREYTYEMLDPIDDDDEGDSVSECGGVTECGVTECGVEQLDENALGDIFAKFGEGIKGILKLCGKGLLVLIAGLGGSFLFGLPGLLIAVMIAFGLLTNDKVTEGRIVVNEGIFGDVKAKLKTVIGLLKADPKKAKEINAKALAAKKSGDKKALQACADEIKAMSKGGEEKPVNEDGEGSSEIRQISVDVIVNGEASDDEILVAVENALVDMDVEVVGGPDFTDASWSKEEYGL